MDMTIAAIIAVILVFAGLYLIEPDGLSGFSGDAQGIDTPREGNGLLGRVIDGVAELTWHPFQFLMIITMVVFLSVGVAVYWRTVED